MRFPLCFDLVSVTRTGIPYLPTSRAPAAISSSRRARAAARMTRCASGRPQGCSSARECNTLGRLPCHGSTGRVECDPHVRRRPFAFSKTSLRVINPLPCPKEDGLPAPLSGSEDKTVSSESEDRVAVYRFQVWDPVVNDNVWAPRMATLQTIARSGGGADHTSEEWVDRAMLDGSGY